MPPHIRPTHGRTLHSGATIPQKRPISFTIGVGSIHTRCQLAAIERITRCAQCHSRHRRRPAKARRPLVVMETLVTPAAKSTFLGISHSTMTTSVVARCGLCINSQQAKPRDIIRREVSSKEQLGSIAESNRVVEWNRVNTTRVEWRDGRHSSPSSDDSSPHSPSDRMKSSRASECDSCIALWKEQRGTAIKRGPVGNLPNRGWRPRVRVSRALTFCRTFSFLRRPNISSCDRVSQESP